METEKGEKRTGGSCACAGRVMKERVFPGTGETSQADSRGSCGISELGYIRAENRESCTFSAHKELTDCGPNRWQAREDREGHKNLTAQRGGPRGQERHSALTSVATNPRVQSLGPRRQKKNTKTPQHREQAR